MRYLKALVIALALALALMPTAASADHTYPQPGAHWPGGPERQYVMVSDRSSLPDWLVTQAIGEWNRSSVMNIVDVGPVCPNTFAPHYCLTIYDDRSMVKWEGYAQAHTLGDQHILAADIYIGTRGTTSLEQRYALLLHEMGHGLGLGHRDNGSGSVMAPFVREYSRADAHDYEQLVINRQH